MTKRVTVILPVRNEERSIRNCLDSVLNQDYPFDHLEILVVDGQSDDSTPRIIHEYQQKHPNLHLIENPGKIVPCGLNKAIQIATGEILIRVDGHTEVAPDYVTACVKLLEAYGADNAGGCMNPMGDNRFGKAVALATSTPFGVGGSRFHYSDKVEWVDSVYMGAWPRSTFERYGLFDEELVRDQDDEFNYRTRKLGGKILLSPEIVSTYHVRSHPKALWRQYFQYGFWKVRVLQKHPRQMSVRQFVPPLFVTALIGGSLLALISPHNLWPLVLVAGAYLAANLCASVWTASRREGSALPLLPLIFAILHLSYGLGFLVGLLHFANRWGDRKGQTPSLH